VHAIFNKLTEFDVVLRHVRHDVTAPEKRHDPEYPFSSLFGAALFGTL